MNRIELIAVCMLVATSGAYAAETHTSSEFHEVRNVAGVRQGERHATREACIAAAEALGVEKGKTATGGQDWFNCYSVKSFKFTYRPGTTTPTPLAAPTNPRAPTISATSTRPQWDVVTGALSYALDSCRGATCTSLTRLACVQTNSYDHTLSANATARYRVAASRATNCSGLGTASPLFLGTTVVQQTNRAPIINGTPATNAPVGAAYSFRPTASDPDGNPLTFRIENKPSWATFDPANGHVGGNPAATNVGTYSNIRILVSDGTLEAALSAFALTVSQPTIEDGQATLSWTPPRLMTNGEPFTTLRNYKILYSASQGGLSDCSRAVACTEIETPADPTLRTYTVRNLAPGTYYFAIRAIAGGGAESSNSNVVQKIIR